MTKKHTTLEIKQTMEQAAKIVELIRRMPKVVISAVHGYAAGAGMSLALSSDLIIAEEGSKFSLSFKNVGLIPEWKAKEWIWKGVTIPVEEAYDYGFIYEIAPKNQALESAFVLAEE